MTTHPDIYHADTLATQTPFAHVCVLDEVDSTQQYARDAIDVGQIKAPAIIVAHTQRAGQGRGRNRWQADAGSLTVTFIMSPPDQAHAPQELPLRAGLAVRRALAQWTGLEAIQIKWPNDVWLHGRKVAGLLCERRRGLDLIGLGVNVHVQLEAMDHAIAQRAASLHEHLRAGETAPDRQALLVAIAHEIARLWQDDDWCDTLNRIHALTGQAITVHQSDGPISGVCEGVDPQGRLLLRTGQTLHHLLDGSIEK